MLPHILQVSADPASRMVQLASILYCRYVFQEFRRPVYISYPDLAESYLSVISRPMDFGTLLLKLLQYPEQMTISEFRDNLQLIYHNALRFNEGYPTLESVSAHLQKTIIGLFEELFQQPFGIKDHQVIISPPENASIVVDEEELIEEYITKKRMARFSSIAGLTLNKTELELLKQLFQDMIDTYRGEKDGNEAVKELFQSFERMIEHIEQQLLPVHNTTLKEINEFLTEEKGYDKERKLLREKKEQETKANQQKDKKSVKIVEQTSPAPSSSDANNGQPMENKEVSTTESKNTPTVAPTTTASTDPSPPPAPVRIRKDITSFESLPTYTVQELFVQVFEPILAKYCTPATEHSNNNTCNQVLFLQSFFPERSNSPWSNCALPPALLHCFLQFQTRFALFAILLEERKFRGSITSFPWCVAYPVCYWSQLTTSSKEKGRAAWWPCMIIASNPTNTATTKVTGGSSSRTEINPWTNHLQPMQEEVMASNISRLSVRLVKEVMKVRPRVVSNVSIVSPPPTATTTTVPTEMSGESGNTLNTESMGPPSTPGPMMSKDDHTMMEVVNASPSSLLLQTPPPVPPVPTTSKSKSKSSSSKSKSAPHSAASAATSTTTTAAGNTPFSCPEGYCLVEYFGDHELSWIKIDTLIPMLVTGELPPLPASARFCSPQIFDEAEETRRLLWRLFLTHQEPSLIADHHDLLSIPTLSELQDMLINIVIAPRVSKESALSTTTTNTATMSKNTKESNKSSGAGNGSSMTSSSATTTTRGGNSSSNGTTSNLKTKKPMYFLPAMASTTGSIHEPTELTFLDCMDVLLVSASGRNKIMKIHEIYDIQGNNLTPISTPSKLVSRDYQRIPYHRYFHPVPGNIDSFDPLYPTTSTVTYIVSLCPLPLPIDDMSDFSSATATTTHNNHNNHNNPNTVVKKEYGTDGDASSDMEVTSAMNTSSSSSSTPSMPGNGMSKAKGLTFRRNALVRTRGFSMYMQHVKPLVLELSSSLPPIGMKGISWGMELSLPLTFQNGSTSTSAVLDTKSSASATANSAMKYGKRKFDEFSITSEDVLLPSNGNCITAREIIFVSDPRGVDFSWTRVTL